jgi:hypothetical protein
MTRKEASDRFNKLPKEHRVTIIANECEQEIRWIEREKRELIRAHKRNLARINERIKIAEDHIRRLKD